MISAITGELRKVDTDRVHLVCGSFVCEILIPAADIPEMHGRINEQITLHTIFDLEGDASRAAA